MKTDRVDKMVGDKLKSIEEQGLADDTIIFYYGDHGSGMPSKRWPYYYRINVPLIVHVPMNGNIWRLLITKPVEIRSQGWVY